MLLYLFRHMSSSERNNEGRKQGRFFVLQYSHLMPSRCSVVAPTIRKRRTVLILLYSLTPPLDPPLFLTPLAPSVPLAAVS